jgi:hypothetical protein
MLWLGILPRFHPQAMDELLRDHVPSWRVSGLALIATGGGFLALLPIVDEVGWRGERRDPLIFPRGSINNHGAEYFSVGLHAISTVLFAVVLLLSLRLCRIGALGSLLRDLDFVPDSVSLRTRLALPVEWWTPHLICLGVCLYAVLALESAYGESYPLWLFPVTAIPCWLLAIASDRLRAVGMMSSAAETLHKTLAAFWVVCLMPLLSWVGVGEFGWWLAILGGLLFSIIFAIISFKAIHRRILSPPSA